MRWGKADRTVSVGTIAFQTDMGNDARVGPPWHWREGQLGEVETRTTESQRLSSHAHYSGAGAEPDFGQSAL